MNILIADDHPLYRQGLALVLQREPDCVIIGEAGNGDTALEMILARNPEIAVLDISMPGKDGLDVVRSAMGQDQCVTEFVVLTMYHEEAYFNEAMDLGVKGYLLKENAPGEIIACLRSVANGIPFVSSQVSHFLFKRIGRMTPSGKNRPSVDDLTPAERRVLKLLGQNKTSPDIARELSISVRTVQNHRASICGKLNLQGYNKLLQFALEHKPDL